MYVREAVIIFQVHVHYIWVLSIQRNVIGTVLIEVIRIIFVCKYFMSEILKLKYFRSFHTTPIFLSINNFHVKFFHQLPRDKNFVTAYKIANYGIQNHTRYMCTQILLVYNNVPVHLFRL